MPSVSKAQQRFFGAEMGRIKKGQKTKTGLGEEAVKEFLILKHKKKGKK